MFETRFLRAAPVFALAFAAFTFSDAEAVSPPDMPLPACVEVDGQPQGACPQTSEDVTGSASGTLNEGGSVTIVTEPTNGVCVYHYGHGPDYPWTPSPCYSAVTAPSVAGCAVIDLTDGGRFREISCNQALYRNSSSAPSPLFSYSGPGGRNGCGRRGDFYTYLYGGPANVAGARWSEFGPAELECQLSFNGPRPDGLYGPTWVKVRVGIEQAQTGDVRRGYGRSAEFYVPIDGDMRDVIDVELQASSVISGSGENTTITYTATLTNRGQRAAEDISVEMKLPSHVHFKSVSNGRCTHTNQFVGGDVRCYGLSLAGAGDGMSGDFEVIDIVTHLMNAADLEPDVTITANVPNDINSTRKQDSTSASPTLSSGSIAQTRDLMRILDPYFDYETPEALLEKQCNVYMADIYERLETIRAQSPEVFANLSYGKITSGDYYWAPIENQITRAGHVGVVVYPTGTNYHETGIVIHGTPTWSPADDDLETQRGRRLTGEHVDGYFMQGTQHHGWYYRTPITNFPGSPKVEDTEGCGFEGVYSTNADEFRSGRTACRVPEPAQTPPTCPAYPDAVIVRTESPVDILLSNSKDQRVETRGGQIFLQELESGIHSFSTPHADGTFGWTLVLPEDDYDIQLLGTGEGPYRLTLTKFDAEGNPVQTVHEGTTASGQVNNYELDGAPLTPPGGGDDGGGDNGGGDTGGNNGDNNGDVGSGGNNGGGAGAPAPRKSGGGSFGFLTLLALLPLMRRRMQRV